MKALSTFPALFVCSLRLQARCTSMWIQMVLVSVKNSPREPFSAKTTSGWLRPSVSTPAYSILQLGGRLGDECMMDIVGGAAQCEEPCIIGVPRKQNILRWAEQGHGMAAGQSAPVLQGFGQ